MGSSSFKHLHLSMCLMLLLLLLSRFSRVRLCATPMTAAHQAPPSLEFSRQEHWSGLPFPSPMHESAKWKWSRSVVLTLSDPMDCSPPGSSVHGIFQARVLEWGAIAFSACALYIQVKRKQKRLEVSWWRNSESLCSIWLCVDGIGGGGVLEGTHASLQVKLDKTSCQRT